MKYGTAAIRRHIVVHLDYGEDMYESLTEVIQREGIINGAIVSGFGTFDRVRYHAIGTVGLPPKDMFRVVEGPYELMSVDGVIAGGKLHAHFVAGDLEHAVGGHLEPGCRVLYLAEVVMAEYEGIDMSFEIEQSTGLRLLAIRGGHDEPGPAVEIAPDGQPSVTGRTKGWAHLRK